MTVTDVNEAPVITSNGGGDNASINLAENATGVTTVIATDEDVPANTLSFSISGGLDSSLFDIDGSGNLTFSSGPNFEVPTDSDLNGVYEVQVTVDDGVSGSDTQNISVTVTDINEDPVITSDGGGASVSINIAENTTAITTVVASDEDVPPNTLAFSISGGVDSALFEIDGSENLSFLSPQSFEVANDDDMDGVYEVQVTVDDGASGSDSQNINVTVTNTNDPPVITSDGGGDNASVTVIEGATGVTTVTATDQDIPADTLTISITGGLDSSFFSIDDSGNMTFDAAPNFEVRADDNSDGIYEVQVTVEDGNLGSDSQNISVTVEDINDAPVITSNGGGSTASISIVENSTGVTTITATDEDTPAQTLTFAITGGADSALFEIDANDRLSFRTPPTFEDHGDSDGDGVYEVQVSVRDQDLASDSQNLSITVTDSNDAPETAEDEYVVTQGQRLRVMAPGVLENDNDPEGNSFTALVADEPAHGQLVFLANGAFQYEPDPAFFGEDVFTYIATDGVADSAPVTVRIIVQSGGNGGGGGVIGINPPDDGAEPPDYGTGNEGDGGDDTRDEAPDDPVDEPIDDPIDDSPIDDSPPIGGGLPNDRQGRDNDGQRKVTSRLRGSVSLDNQNSDNGSDRTEFVILGPTDVGSYRSRLSRFVIQEIDSNVSPVDPIGADVFQAEQVDVAVLRQELEEAFAESDQLEQWDFNTGSATFVAGALTAAYVFWALKGSYLATSMLSALPVWRFIDPLPFLDTFDTAIDQSTPKRSDDETEFEVESMFLKSD